MTIRALHAFCVLSISMAVFNFESKHVSPSSRLASAFQPHFVLHGRNSHQQVSREFLEKRSWPAGGLGPLHSILNPSSESSSDNNDHLKLSPHSSCPAELVPYTHQDQFLRETTIDKDSQVYVSLMVYFRKLNEWYTIVNSTVRCPFFRRRFSDAIDSLAMMGRFLVIRHKSVLSDPSFTALLGYEYTVPGCLPVYQKRKGETKNVKGQDKIHAGNEEKLRGLSLESVENYIKKDWLGKHPSGNRGYYLTGKLSSQIYRNDCFFNGPDPDMPVRGLRKYLSAAAHLFDQGKSHADMLDISRNEDDQTITVKWLLGGILMLPWRPKVNDWTGSTTYSLDSEGLIYKHQEEWDISVWEAFISTAFPGVGHMVWGGTLPFLQ